MSTDDEYDRLHADARKLLAQLRREDRQRIIAELGIHVESPENKCLCAMWNGDGTFQEHVTDQLLNILYGNQ